MKRIVSNHKMNLTKEEVKAYEEEIRNYQTQKCELIFCPSFPYLSYFEGKNYSLGSQNVASSKMGALTGEVSIEQLKSMNVKYIIIGHSERRNLLKETKEEIRIKVGLCLEYGITPILCIGEKEEEQNRKEEILKDEIDSVLKENSITNILIAYEPIWAIGTGKIPTAKEIDETLSWIKNYIRDNYHCSCETLYGGSINDQNIQMLNEIPSIDGYLIGGASLDVEKLKKIIDVVEG